MEIVDFETGEIISGADAARYVVLVDANHRYKAHLNLLEANKELKDEEKYKGEFYLIYALYLQLIIPQYFISNKSGIWSLSLIVHSKG